MNPDVVHRLGAMVCAAAGLLWVTAAVDAWRKRRRALRRREAVVIGATPDRARAPGKGRVIAGGRWGEPALAGRRAEAVRGVGPSEAGYVVGRVGAVCDVRGAGSGFRTARTGVSREPAFARAAFGSVVGATISGAGFVGRRPRTGALSDETPTDAARSVGARVRAVTGRGAAATANRKGAEAVDGPGPTSPAAGSGAVRRWLPVVGVAFAGYAIVGGALGGFLGALCGAAAWWWQHRPVPAQEYDVAWAVRELPLAADLLAACIAAGADPVTAAQVVGESLEGPVGRRLVWGAAEIRLGGEPAEAWRRLAAIPGARPFARLLERAGDSGAPAAAPVARLAAEARAEWGRKATETARRAAVLVTAPVGLCFLPAFITVGVVPLLIGLAGGLLRGGGG
jgi:hypothetical protein